MTESAGYSDDLELLAKFGWGPDHLGRMGRSGMPAGALSAFMSLEQDARELVLRLLDSPIDDGAFAELDAHPAGTALAQFLLTLPAYRDATEGE